MKIVHVSYARVMEYSDPEEWLKKIDFFTGIVDQMGLQHDVLSLHCINYEGIIKRGKGNYNFLKTGSLSPLFPFRLHAVIKAFKPDAVIVHGIHFAWQIFLLQLQLGNKIRIYAQHHAERPLRFHKKYLHRINDKIIRAYFFSSVDLASGWVKKGLIKDESKVREIMEASSVFHVMDKQIAQRITGVAGFRNYLWIGRLNTNKDPVTLIKGFIQFLREERKAKLYVIFQENELLDEIKSLAGDYSENIFLIGKIPHAELLYWFNSVDFVISTSHYEGSGIAVCEAMSCGCIPIVTDIPSFRMMTNNGTCGLMFRPGDVRDCYTALTKSRTLLLPIEREKVLRQFNENLSFGAIAAKMLVAVEGEHNLKK
jgi:glycosyltransferase involved in cell wall biosynthesis